MKPRNAMRRGDEMIRRLWQWCVRLKRPVDCILTNEMAGFLLVLQGISSDQTCSVICVSQIRLHSVPKTRLNPACYAIG